ncbi:MAG: helix-turn-helix domain-containing protein [Oscillospiraceae bacterium]|nr:helix-turn-helix domain-containing protein [Oscillospiraceae bacterium]
MDYTKVGNLILKLRTEKGMTQKQLAEQLHISDKTVSKWERGVGLPDVSLLTALSALLEVDMEKILQGDLAPNDLDGGNMRRLKFYTCPCCGNVITATGETELSCCGRKLAALQAQSPDEKHSLTVEQVEDDYYITFTHVMTKAHFISFVAHIVSDRVLLIKLYPEQNPEVRFPKRQKGKIYYYCSQDGLYVYTPEQKK